MKLSVVIPAHDEADSIGETVSPTFALNVSTLTLTPSEAATPSSAA